MDLLYIKNLKDYRERLVKHPTKHYLKRSLSAITHIAVHHSATTSGSAEAYARYHVKELGWPGIGYHFVIEKDGLIKWSNDLETKSYHVGQSNSFAVGICLTGDFRSGEPTSSQKMSLFYLLKSLMLELNINYDKVLGHNQFPGYGNKLCPCIDMVTIRQQLQKPSQVPLGQNETVLHKKNWKQDISERFPNTSPGVLKKLNPTLPESVPSSTLIKVKGEPEKISDELLRLIKVMDLKGYPVLRDDRKDFNLNIVGIRNPKSVPDLFDDRIIVFWRYDNKWNFKSFLATTDPGLPNLYQPVNPSGTAILKEGYYQGSHRIGLHKGKYKALVQAAPVTVIRDFNRDSKLDFDSGREEIGLYGINIHRASEFGESKTVNKWSAGCQVFANPTQFNEFMGLCENSSLNWGNSFSYTLLNGKDLV